MNNKEINENDYYKFECSQCDVKYTSERDIINHSIKHKCNNSNGLVNISTSDTSTKEDTNETNTMALTHASFKKHVSENCKTLANASKKMMILRQVNSKWK